ncbi:MAG TPA: hypothetical protein VLX90_19645, partial [Steroidobacteraceae bacterium]|nr:hypothetical protein [Steroidobacteraceae bacterium]
MRDAPAGQAQSSAQAGATTAARTPITHEKLWMMPRVGAPAVSPDGKWVVFAVLEPSYDSDKEVSDLWLVPADGSAAPRRITNTKAAESGVAWSHDSRRIAFSTKREGDEAEQIYILDLAQGGEARRLTHLSTGASGPRWRPDDQAILFESTVYPNAPDDEANRKIAAERKERKYNVRAYEHFPIRFWNQWLDDRQPTLLIQPLQPGAQPRDILSPTALAHTAGFSGIINETNITLAPLWSPDGTEVIFAATTERWNSAYAHVGSHLFRMPAAGGEPRILTPEPGEYDDARFAPDGRSLFFKYTVQDQEIYHLSRVRRVSWPAPGAPAPVTPGLDRETMEYALTPDSRSLYLLVSDAGKQALYRAPAAGGKPALVVEPATGGYTHLDIPEKAPRPVLIGSYGSSVSPQEIVRI